ncbi:MAG: hypothetical protein JWM16_8 [Verrucomicrobiales bacterium]|nr:hypothetical protein [Verrucomicrobiales bacterium]
MASATDAIYINDSVVFNPPPIDARAFLNRAQFGVSTSLPYETFNTINFTNTASGIMSGSPGFRLLLVTNTTLLPALNFVNQGQINGSTYVEVQASNIMNSGPITVSDQGRILISGKNVNLSRNALRSGPISNSCISTLFGPTYVNPAGVVDLYWGNGQNNRLDATGKTMPLDAGNFDLPFPFSPAHQVIDGSFPGSTFTNNVIVGGSDYYGAWVHRSVIDQNKYAIQVVFAPTNFFNTNITTDVRFDFNGNDGYTAVVGFNSPDFDIVLQKYVTNHIYLLDSMAFKNVALSRNSSSTPITRRPNNYATATTTPPCEFVTGFPANAVFTPDLIYNPITYQTNNVAVQYSGYSASFNEDRAFVSVNPLTLAGRIEVYGDTMVLDQTRIRAEQTISIKTANLISNKVARVDAPFMIYDLTSTLPQLVVSNLAPATVNRLFGQVEAWSATWKNFERLSNVTNELNFHVLIVGHSLEVSKPVTIDTFAAKAPSVTVADPLRIRTAMKLDAPSLTVNQDLILPFASQWSKTNVLNVLDFTNRGNVVVSQAAYYGADRAQGYNSFVNTGTNSAVATFIQSGYFENAGCVQSSGGILNVAANQAYLHGLPTSLYTNVFTNAFFQFPGIWVTNVQTNTIYVTSPAKLQANSDVQVSANQLVLSNAVIQAGLSSPGALTLSVTSRLVDSGQDAKNQINVTSGLNVPVKPQFSDLLATYVNCTAGFSMGLQTTWAGSDLGRTTQGFTNNLAIGKLTLDGAQFSQFTFAAPPGQSGKALYVEYLELLNYATNFLSGSLSIDPSITIYFANANIPAAKLDNSNGGRLRWVRSFTGPLSSTNVVYPSGEVFTLNTALVTSKDIDSDCDGIVNADDPTPIYSADQALLSATRTATTNNVVAVALTWKAICGSTSWVEYKPSFTSANWLPLTQYINNTGVSTNYTYLDGVTNTFRIYRLRVNPPQP